MKYSIVIPTYKHLDKLKECCQSIIDNVNLTDLEVIVVANGCGNDGTKGYVNKLSKKYPSFKLIWIKEQYGYTKSTNVGMKAATGEYIILLNNDTQILSHSWPYNAFIDILENPFKRDPTVGMTGPMKELCHQANRKFILFFCVMISRKVIDKIGYLDEIFSPGYGEDTDFCCRAEDAGFKLVQVPAEGDFYYEPLKKVGNFPLHHIGTVTFSDPENQDASLIHRNNEILRRMYNSKNYITPIEETSEPLSALKAQMKMDKNHMYDKDGKVPSQELAREQQKIDYPHIDISKAQACDGWISDEELTWLAQKVKNLGK